MCQLVLLVVSVVQRYEDAQIVCSGNDADVGARELCTKLIEASCGYALLGTINVESGHGRMVRCLFCEVGKLHALVASDAAGAA